MLEPKVELINYTQDALETLIYTKSGRLKTGITLAEIKRMPHTTKMSNLGYMMDTIKSSFEFVDYHFELFNVSRAFTHQFVRTRPNSYQQEAMRVVDARDEEYIITTDHPAYKEACDFSKSKYAEMLDDGIEVQNARGVLPIAIHTRIQVKVNLRTLSQMAELRLCKRAEGEYQDVFKLIVDKVLGIHPWAEPLLRAHCVKYGFCVFPRYNKCPVKEYCFELDEPSRLRIEEAWKSTNHVANPVANKDGMTM